MRLLVDDVSGFWATDEHGRRWTCHTVTEPNPVFPHWPIVTTTYWRLVYRREGK